MCCCFPDRFVVLVEIFLLAVLVVSMVRFAKYYGVCNDSKIALDQCFRKEKEVKRKANADAARAARKKFEDRIAERRRLSAEE
jgi:hypothetical protein